MSGNVPFGLRQFDGRLVPHPVEAAVVREIVEIFLASGGRMKATAAGLNAKGYRTRQGSRWSDMAVSRALRVVAHDGVVPDALRERCLVLLRERSESAGSPNRRPVHPLGGAVHCACGGRLYLVGTGVAGKFVCRGCRAKIPAETLERLFQGSLTAIEVTAEEIVAALSDNPRAAEITRRLGGAPVRVADIWAVMGPTERQLLVDVAVSRIVLDRDRISVVYALEADAGAESVGFSDETLPSSHGFGSPENMVTEQGNGHPRVLRSPAGPAETESPSATEPKAYRIRQVADLLSLPKSTVYDMVRTGALASVRTGAGTGGVVLIPAGAVAEFLERKKRRR